MSWRMKKSSHGFVSFVINSREEEVEAFVVYIYEQSREWQGQGQIIAESILALMAESKRDSRKMVEFEEVKDDVF